ncbi:MAG: TIGR00730 family Rossman fold protein [Paracoccaceae bacterium]|nr:TIGR00730 family Rossman fold protein [Paracoccaceae bacterium]
MKPIRKSVCVFCGSRAGKASEYAVEAKKLGKIIAENNWRLVYGAGNVGLMGVVANSVQFNKGEILGVIPKHLLEREVGKTDLSTFIITENMHERKKVMFMNSDFVVILPGGLGTLDEFFEILTWKQLGLHEKKIIIININGFWDKLIELLDNLVKSEFADLSIKDYFYVVKSVDELLSTI